MPTSAAPHLDLGRQGEDLAARYLEHHLGLVILSRNWRCSEGELDLVATDGRTLIVCEVKTRRTTDYGTPGEAVTEAKARRIRRLTRRWQHAHHTPHCTLRFDILSILWPANQPPRIKHLPGVF
jgi:putative endonuclease